MARTRRPASAKRQGKALGRALKEQRNSLDPTPSASTVAAKARISVDELRKIERGTIADPGFFTITRVARQLGVSLTELEARTRERTP